jgi:hypothetical protein
MHALSGLLFALLLIASPVLALAAQTEHEGWLQVTASGPLGARLRAFVEVQPRFGEDPQDGDFDVRSLVVRGALGWQILEGWSLWGGYGYTPVYDKDRGEHRAFQQSLADWTLGPFHLQHRARLEQRFFEHESEASWRLRNQLRLVWPLPSWPSWSLIVADEVFVHLNSVDDGPDSGFDQNRFFAGIAHQWTSRIRVEIDYLHQALHRARGSADIRRHSVVVQMAIGW